MGVIEIIQGVPKIFNNKFHMICLLALERLKSQTAPESALPPGRGQSRSEATRLTLRPAAEAVEGPKPPLFSEMRAQRRRPDDGECDDAASLTMRYSWWPPRRWSGSRQLPWQEKPAKE